MSALAGRTIAVIGGDAREREVTRMLLDAGARVTTAARPVGDSPAIWCASILDALLGADAMILPMPGVDAKGRVSAPLVPETYDLTAEDLAALRPGAPIFVGVSRPALSEPAARLGHQVHELAENDEVAILNSIPTAEGAIMIAMEMRPITIHGSQAVVLGLGRCGLTLARDLHALGAKVTVVARKAADRARAVEMGLEAVDYAQLNGPLAAADFIFNLVPAPVLTVDRLEVTKPDCLIIDLASAPGGTDFAAAKCLGREALLAPGLPGKVAPRTAGRIIGRVIIAALANSC